MTLDDAYVDALRREYGGGAAMAYAARDEEKWVTPSAVAVALRDLCDRTHPKDVLELGCGTGRYFPFVAGDRFVGIDVAPDMLAIARSRADILSSRGFHDVELVEDEAIGALGRFGPASFDLVYSIGFLGYHERVTAATLRRFARILRPTGVVFLQTTQQPWRTTVRVGPRRLIDRARGRQPFFAPTTRAGLRRSARRAALEIESCIEDDRAWFGRPTLLTVLRQRGES